MTTASLLTIQLLSTILTSVSPQLSPIRIMDNPAGPPQRGAPNAQQAPTAGPPGAHLHNLAGNHGNGRLPQIPVVNQRDNHHGALFAAHIRHAVRRVRALVALFIASFVALLAWVLLQCEHTLAPVALTQVLLRSADMVFRSQDGWGSSPNHIAIYLFSLCAFSDILEIASGWPWYFVLHLAIHCWLRTTMAFASLLPDRIQPEHRPLQLIHIVFTLVLAWRVIAFSVRFIGFPPPAYLHVPKVVYYHLITVLVLTRAVCVLYPVIKKLVVTATRMISYVVSRIGNGLCVALASVLRALVYLHTMLARLRMRLHEANMERLDELVAQQLNELAPAELLPEEVAQVAAEHPVEAADQAEDADTVERGEASSAWVFTTVQEEHGESEWAQHRALYPIPEAPE